jgi:hypothetical protein
MNAENNTKKILVACPTAEIKQYCMGEWLANVENFTYKNFDVFMCDNSPDYSFYSYWKNIVNMEHLNPKRFASYKHCLAASHERCRVRALTGGYDYLLHLESDVFPPSNIIERLLDADKGIVGALYHINHGEKSSLMVQKLEDMPYLMKIDRESHGEQLKISDNLDYSDLSFVDGTVKRAFHIGLGCVLIHRSVLKTFKFRYENDADVHPDSFFAADMDMIGMPIHIDTSIICTHKNQPLKRI